MNYFGPNNRTDEPEDDDSVPDFRPVGGMTNPITIIEDNDPDEHDGDDD